MEMANTLAYYNMAKITAVKCYIKQAPVVSSCKAFPLLDNVFYPSTKIARL